MKSSTKFTPNQIRDLNDKYQINIIIENMVKASKKNIIDNKHILDVEEKLLLCNEIVTNNNILTKKKLNIYLLIYQ